MLAFNLGSITSLVLYLKRYYLMVSMKKSGFLKAHWSSKENSRLNIQLKEPIRDSLEILSTYRPDKVFRGRKWSHINRVLKISYLLFGLVLIVGGLYITFCYF